MITSAKKYTKKPPNPSPPKNQVDRTLGQMVKAKLYRQNHTKKHTHTHSQKEKKEKIYILLLPKSTASILGLFVVYSGIPQMQATSG